MRGVEIERAHITHIQQIPAYTLALFHGHHRPVAVEVSVDGILVVGLGKAGACEREVSLRIGKVGFSPFEPYLSDMNNPGLNVVGALPPAASTPIDLTGWISASAPDRKAARQLLDYFKSKEAAPIWEEGKVFPITK